MRLAHVIALANHKGGVGKSTSTLNIGAGLARAGKRTLLVDMDPQSNLTLSLGFRDALERTVYDVLSGEASVLETVRETSENLALLPATLDLAGAEVELQSKLGREHILRLALEPALERYDFVLVDAPPSLGLLTVNALAAAEEVFVPVQCESLALHGLAKFLQVVSEVRTVNRSLRVSGILATRYDGRKVLNRDVLETMREEYGALVFTSVIRDNIALAEAMGTGADIFTYAPRSYGAEDYEALVSEVLTRINSGGGQ